MLRSLVRRLSPSDTTRRSFSSASSRFLSQEDAPKHADRLLVIGSGVAGSAAALIAAQIHKIPVTLLFAGNVPTDCNSYWAQGGIIYRNYDEKSGDSAESLAQDILRAGAGLCRLPAVEKVATEGPDRVRQLLLNHDSAETSPFASVPFDRTAENEWSLCLEASHAAPRILHKADHTGKTITQHLTQAVQRHPLITAQPHTVVTDLIVQDDTCVGVQTLDRATGQLQNEYATRGTVLCAGGLAGIYEHSTNPAGFNALGSSVAMSARAGVHVQDLEYVQFHPTSLYMPGEARFLLTEALRGEGAILRNADGHAFAREYHEDGELAPRDVVARAVYAESQKSGSVFLDITHRDGEWLHQRFPSIQEHLSARNLDMAQHPLPIIPAAHYTCGGIATDLHGRTNVRGLFAAGEAACTGLHGGNRLASTSLLEGLVFGAAVADHCGSDAGLQTKEVAQQVLGSLQIPGKNSHRHRLEPMHIENAHHRAAELLRRLRRTMWDHVGVARTMTGLGLACDELAEIRREMDHLHATCPTLETAAVRDAACAGQSVAEAAAANTTSAGAHYIVAEEGESDSDDDLVDVAADAR